VPVGIADDILPFVPCRVLFRSVPHSGSFISPGPGRSLYLTRAVHVFAWWTDEFYRLDGMLGVPTWNYALPADGSQLALPSRWTTRERAALTPSA